jgi:hypothetical protein
MEREGERGGLTARGMDTLRSNAPQITGAWTESGGRAQDSAASRRRGRVERRDSEARRRRRHEHRPGVSGRGCESLKRGRNARGRTGGEATPRLRAGAVTGMRERAIERALAAPGRGPEREGGEKRGSAGARAGGEGARQGGLAGSSTAVWSWEGGRSEAKRRGGKGVV